MGHAGSDIESNYLNLNEIEEKERNDPLLHSARTIINNNLLSSDEILDLYEQARIRIHYVFEKATSRPKLTLSSDVMKSIISNNSKNVVPNIADEEIRKKIFNIYFIM